MSSSFGSNQPKLCTPESDLLILIPSFITIPGSVFIDQIISQPGIYIFISLFYLIKFSADIIQYVHIFFHYGTGYRFQSKYRFFRRISPRLGFGSRQILQRTSRQQTFGCLLSLFPILMIKIYPGLEGFQRFLRKPVQISTRLLLHLHIFLRFLQIGEHLFIYLFHSSRYKRLSDIDL